jgi:hypothetical protein
MFIVEQSKHRNNFTLQWILPSDHFYILLQIICGFLHKLLLLNLFCIVISKIYFRPQLVSYLSLNDLAILLVIYLLTDKYFLRIMNLFLFPVCLQNCIGTSLLHESFEWIFPTEISVIILFTVNSTSIWFPVSKLYV